MALFYSHSHAPASQLLGKRQRDRWRIARGLIDIVEADLQSPQSHDFHSVAK